MISILWRRIGLVLTTQFSMVIISLGSAALVLTGCASTQTLSPPAYDHAKYRSLSLLRYDEKPELSIDSRLKGQLSSSALEGAAAGAGETTMQCLQVPYPPLLLVCGLVGATVGGITSYEKGVPSEPVRKSAEQLIHKVQDVGVQGYIRQQAMQYMSEQHLPTAETEGESDTIISIYLKKVEVRSLDAKGKNFPGIILMTFSGQLIQNSKILDAYDVRRAVIWDDVEALQGGRGKDIADKVDATITSIVQGYIDEFILVYHPPGTFSTDLKQSSNTFPSTLPAYILRPIHPPASAEFQSTRTIAYPSLHEADLIFQWESYPRTWDMPEKDINDISQVTYDFRLYSEERDLIYERTELTKPSHSPEIQLRPCSKYSWAVRSRFMLRGYPRVTEWSGMYNKNVPISSYTPTEIRRNQTFLPELMESYSIGFTTAPAAPGMTCEVQH